MLNKYVHTFFKIVHLGNGYDSLSGPPPPPATEIQEDLPNDNKHPLFRACPMWPPGSATSMCRHSKAGRGVGNISGGKKEEGMS